MLKTLRDYQAEAVTVLAGHVEAGHRVLGLNAPTGSGKTLLLSALLARLQEAGRFRRAVVVAPTLQTENNFWDDVAVATPDRQYEIPRDRFWLRLRDGTDKRAEFDAHLAGTRDEWALLTTHAQAGVFGISSLPADLDGLLLVIDEAHHAGTEDDRAVTKIGDFACGWRSRGGTVLYATATPYRHDGADVFPPGAATFVWPIAQHSVSGHAPNDFRIQAVLLSTEATSAAEFAGDSLSDAEDERASSVPRIVDRWVSDGRPKAVVIVPQGNARAWSERLCDALTKAGARVVDAVGTGTDVAERLLAVLRHEQAVTTFADSTADVIVACKRFDEGTDWPLCSHVYNYGVPGSLGLTVQRWGRAFRSKGSVAGYPGAHRESAHLTFFVPRISAEVLDEFERKHHHHAFLLAALLGDFRVARDYAAAGRSAERVSDVDRVKAAARLAHHGLAFEEAAGRPPTIGEASDYLDALDLRDEERRAGRAVLASWIRPDAEERFEEVVEAYRDRTCAIAGEVLAIYSGFTGQDAATVSARLAGQTEKPDLTEDMIRDAAERFKAEHGRWPNQKDGDATRYFGFPEVWATVDSTLVRGGRGLGGSSSLPTVLGTKPPALTENTIRNAAARYRERHGRWPSEHSGDATLDFGHRESWNAIAQALRAGCRGLPGGQTLRAVLDSQKPDLTVACIRAAAARFHEQHGRWPRAHQNDSDATDYFGYPETWNAVHQALSRGYRGLPGGDTLQDLLGTERPPLTPEIIVAAAQRFRETHGRWPSHASGDATPYFGHAETWASVNVCLSKGHRGLPGGTTLSRLLGRSKPALTEATVCDAAQRFMHRNGRWPQQRDGDATEYFGFEIRWQSVNALLGRGGRGLPGGSSLARLRDRVLLSA